MNAVPPFLACAALLLVAGCGRQAAPDAEDAPARLAAVAAASPSTVTAGEEVVGSVAAAQQAVLSAKVTGVIDSVKTAPGAMVRKGDVLAAIDAREIKARLDQALAAQQQARRDYERVERLLRSGSSTRQEFDAVTTRLLTADAGAVEARTMLQYTEITAPFDGVVTRKLAEVGDLATPGKALLEMENSSLLRFECEVPEALVDRVTMGAEIPVKVDAAGAALTGRVSEIAPSASLGSRTFLVKIDLPAADKLRAGQFGRASIPAGDYEAVLVPQAAVVRRGQIESVFVVKDGRASLRLVKTGPQHGGAVEIVSGLDGGELVVASEVDLLRDGDRVEVRP
jgi:membrane fusion protein (multidrug efflux system)